MVSMSMINTTNTLNTTNTVNTANATNGFAKFALIFRHYFIRNCRDIISLLVYGILPIGIITVNYFIINNLYYIDEATLATSPFTYVDEATLAASATSISTFILMAFQFFCGDVLVYNLNSDFRSPMRWRLYSSPVTNRTFILAIITSSWIYSIIYGVIIIIFSTLIFNVYWGNLVILFSVFLIISVIAQFTGILICLLTKTQKVGSTIMQIICFGMMILSGGFFIPLGDSEFARFLTTYGTPVSLAYTAVLNAHPYLDNINQSIFNLGILAVIALVMVAIVLVLGRRRAI